MKKIIDEIKDDVEFIKSHELQPKWYKVLKVFILLGAILGYYTLFGTWATVLFFSSFMLLNLALHLIYRAKTKKWTQTWLDFVVIEKDGKFTTERIGLYYYSAIVINTILSQAISQFFA